MTMETLWKIALRNTLRHRRRTIITAIVMMVGIAIFIMFDSVLTGMDRNTVDNMARFTTSYLKLRNPAYVDDIAGNPLDKAIAEPGKALAAVAAAGFAGAPRLSFVARLSNYEDEIPVLAQGVDPGADAKVFDTAASVIEGSWLDPAAPNANAVVMGANLAAELGLKIGDGIIASVQTLGEASNADEYIVVGLVRTPAPEINIAGLFMPLGAARILLDAPNIATEIDVRLPRAQRLDQDIANAAAAAKSLGSALPGLRADPLGDLVQDYLAMRNMKAKFSYVMILLVLLIAGVGIVNTILMSVYSRIREIGVLRAYGMTPKDIGRLFTLEGLAVGLIGSILGVLLGILLDYVMIRWGINIDKMMDASTMGSIPIAGIMRGEWNPKTMVAGFLFGMATALVAASIPARMAARLEPTAALRYV
jgi:putative ABC transport system permease protein